MLVLDLPPHFFMQAAVKKEAGWLDQAIKKINED
jgi:hypothetical protein